MRRPILSVASVGSDLSGLCKETEAVKSNPVRGVLTIRPPPMMPVVLAIITGRLKCGVLIYIGGAMVSNGWCRMSNNEVMANKKTITLFCMCVLNAQSLTR